MLRPGQLVVNVDHGFRRQRKTHARIGVGFAQNCGVDADHFAVHIDQRSAGVAGIDGGIGLNEGLELPAGNDVASLGRNDSCGYRLRQSERTAHGQNPVAYLHAVGVAHLGGGQRAIHVNLDHGKIGFLIGADDFGVVLHARRIILKPHANAVGFLDHMPVGDDVSLGIDNHARTQGALADRAIARTAGTRLTARATEEVVEEVVHPAATVIVVLTLPPRRRWTFLMVDSVLMLTTLGSSCFAICENVFDICCGEGKVSGVASLFCPSFPLTP